MRILLAGITALALTACTAPAPQPAGNADQPNEAVVEAEFQNQQDALAASIENDADAADAADANSADESGTAYSCDKGIAVMVAYADDGDASLVTGGKTIALKAVPAASGSKYRADAGLAPGKSLIWWSKGDTAMLIQAPRGAKDGEHETVVNCRATDPDR